MPFAIPGLSGVVTGAMALLLILGAVVLLHMLARAIDNMIGQGWLTRVLNNIDDAVHRALNAVGAWFDGMVTDVARAIEAFPRALDEAMSWIEWSLRSKSEWLKSIIYTWIPDLWHNLTSSISGVYNWVVGWVTGQINAVYDWTMRLTDWVRGWVSGLVNDIYTWANRAFNAVYSWAIEKMNAIYGWTMVLADGIKAWVSGLVNDIYGWSVRQLTGLQQWVMIAIGVSAGQTFNAAVERAKQLSDQGIGALESFLAVVAGTPLAAVWPRILDAVDDIAAAFPGSLAGVLPRLGAIPRALPKSLAGILAAVGALSAVGVDWIRECGMPLCRRLGGFGREIEALQDGLLIIALLEIAQDAIHDPMGSAADAASVFDSLVRDAGAALIDAVQPG